jgi:hypothetical protein
LGGIIQSQGTFDLENQIDVNSNWSKSPAGERESECANISVEANGYGFLKPEDILAPSKPAGLA